MSRRLMTVESLHVGAHRLGRATLNLYREESAPGVPAEKSWAVFGRLGRRTGPLPEEPEAVIALEDGRTVRGRARLTTSLASAD